MWLQEKMSIKAQFCVHFNLKGFSLLFTYKFNFFYARKYPAIQEGA